MNSLLRDVPVLVITGPTASGKTSLAIRIAKQINGEIISADSMQIYRGLDVGTAKATVEEQDGIPHHLYDIRNADERYSVAHFLEDSRQLICEIIDRQKTPIICGGTGQFICALVDGLQFLDEETDLEYRDTLKRKITQRGLEEVHQELQVLDPVAASRINPNDEKRIVRFFEVYQKTGLTSSEVYTWSRQKGPDFTFLTYVLWPERQDLYKRINQRSEYMLDSGMVEELDRMMSFMPHFPRTQAYQAIGYKEIMPYRCGHESKKEAIDKLSLATRRYAKRQYTMFRRREDFIKCSPEDDSLVKRIIDSLK